MRSITMLSCAVMFSTFGCSGPVSMLSDGGCPSGTISADDQSCGQLPDGGSFCQPRMVTGQCLTLCTTDAQCPGARCQKHGFFNGGDYNCNKVITACGTGADECN